MGGQTASGTQRVEAETACFWILGLALLARNDGHVVVVMPAKAGVQRMDSGSGSFVSALIANLVEGVSALMAF